MVEKNGSYKEKILLVNGENKLVELKKVLFNNIEKPTEQEYLIYINICYITHRITNTINGFLDMNKTNSPYYDRAWIRGEETVIHQGNTWNSRINVKSWNTYSKILEKNKLINEALALVQDQEKKNLVKKWIANYYRSIKSEIRLTLWWISRKQEFTIKPKVERHERQSIIVSFTSWYEKRVKQSKIDQYQWNVIYNMMWDKQDDYRDINEKWEYTLNQLWMRKISEVFRTVINAYLKFNFSPMGFIFTHQTASILQKLVKWGILDMQEIWELFSEITIYAKPMSTDLKEKSEFNEKAWHKRLFNSCLYGTWYMREKYEYANLRLLLWEDFENMQSKILNNVMTDNYNAKDFWFNSIRIKWDFKMWMKAQRWNDNIWDMIWWRTTYSATIFNSDEDRREALLLWIEKISDYFNSLQLDNGNQIKIESVMVVNKYHTLTTKNSKNDEFRNRIWCKDIRDDTLIVEESNNIIQLHSKLVENWTLPSKLMYHLANRLNNGSTGSNWKYEDLKVKFEFSIIDKSWTVLHSKERTWWIEWQFIFSDSGNEAWDANHDIVLSSEKVLDVLCKNKSSIGLNEAMNIYRGWINRHIAKMKKWNNKDYDPSKDNLNEEYIEQQFDKQNCFTFTKSDWWKRIILFSNWLTNDEETDLILHLLQQQFEANKMTPLYYTSDLSTMWVVGSNSCKIANWFPTNVYSMYEQWKKYWLHKFRFIRQSTYPYLLSNNISHKTSMWFLIDEIFYLIPTPIVSEVISENPILYDQLNAKKKGLKTSHIFFWSL